MKKIFIIITCFALFIAPGCNDEEYFELTNPVESPWPSLADFEKAPIGAYYGLTGNGGWRTIFAAGRIAGTTFADGANLAPETAGYGVNGDVEDIYTRAPRQQIALFDNPIFNSGYFAVGFANGAIDHIIENDGNPYPLENNQAEVDRIHGELRFVRAYAYYWLARIYLPAYPNDQKRIPFRREQADNFNEAVESELASANDIYPLIVDDLRMAKDLLPEEYDPALHPPAYADGRATKFAASALLAKVLFQMGEYDEALTELDFVIDQNGGLFDLSEDPIEAFNKTGPNRGKEVIWYYALWTGDGLGGSSNWKHPGRFEWYNATKRNSMDPATNNGRFIITSDAFLQQVGWMNSDFTETEEALMDKRYTQLFARYVPAGSSFEGDPEPNGIFAPERPYVWNHKYYRSDTDRSTNLPILRLADMYLLRAIIRAQHASSLNVTGARADLNMVRNRAGLDDFAGTDGELVEAIHLERWKEMAFEGDRLYYLQGNRVDIPNGDRGSGSIPWNSDNLYSDVPQYEQDVNLGYIRASE